MEDFLLFVLVVAFVWVSIRVSRLSTRVKDLEQELSRTPRPAAQRTAAFPPPPPIAHSAQPAAAHIASPAASPYKPAFIPPAPTPPPAAAPLRTATPSEQPSAAAPSPEVESPRRPAPPPPTFNTPVSPKPHLSLEARLGQNWLNKLGITALVIGLALGLGKLIVNIGPAGKDAIGFALAIGILGLGIFLERKPAYKLFARVLIGGGWALTFFLSYALYNVTLLQVLHSETLDLVLMFAVAAAMVAHSLRYHSQVVTTFAFLLAFITVGLSNVTLFSLVAGALLTAALAFIVYRERWYALGLAGLIGVYTNHFLWLHRVLPGGGIAYLHQYGHPFSDFLPSTLLLLAYWLIFRLIYVLRPPQNDASHDANHTLATLAALLNSAGLLGLMKYQSSHPEWAFYGLIAIGLAELALALVARGSLMSDAEAQPNRIAFITLSTLASVLLLAAIPFKFHGSSWILFWFLEAEAFFLTGIRIPEVVFRRLGFATSLLASLAVIAVSSVLLIDSAAAATFIGHKVVVLFAAALLVWFNAEFTTRRWSTSHNVLDLRALHLSGYLAPILAALGLAFLLHPNSAWLGIAWMLLALALSFTADRLRSTHLATQADLLALAAIVRSCAVNLFLNTEHTHGFSTRLLTVGILAALLYLSMRRKAASYLLTTNAIAPAYTWIAGALAALLCWYQLEPVSVAVAWGIFGLVLFELGILFRRSYLRHQSYVLLLAAFIRIFFANMQVPDTSGDLSPSLYTVLPLIAAFAYLYERTQSLASANSLSFQPDGSVADSPTVRHSTLDLYAGTLFSWCALIAAGTLLYFELRPGWILLAWTLLSIAVLALAAILKRTIFIAQSLLTLLFVTGRGIAYHLFYPAPLATTFITSRLFTIGLTSALLLLALPIAFYLRNHFTTLLTSRPEAAGRGGKIPAFGTVSSLSTILHHPEQPFFFAPLLLLTLLLYVHFTGGAITIAWVALGVLTFLFALAVKERSYRLCGLALLLLGVAKVLLWDVWHVPANERYLTLIIMGAALLLVSFLYSRYRETLLKLL
ncbi:DUF2339 domain-containing protein [Granulicella paludicola]|uniref:DUF2339 domain-containing protein n=1 Tax=Granulicella paludicola TaxID=474951 RepID=UPI0021DFCEA1|nr:DUF2339 domain-containing protein [Granulicella paludicola]